MFPFCEYVLYPSLQRLCVQELVEAVVLPMTQAERFKAVGIQPPKVRSCRV